MTTSLFWTSLLANLIMLINAYSLSIIEKSGYLDLCQNAILDESLFENFKNDRTTLKFIENITQNQGKGLEAYILKEYKELIPYMDAFKKNDTIGNPLVYSYATTSLISPTTLHYIKIAGDLKLHFGDLINSHIIEIGGGYGGQCAILALCGGFSSYTIVDEPQCNQLTKKYLDLLGVTSQYEIHFVNKTNGFNIYNAEQYENLESLEIELKNVNHKYDLVISNNRFSQCDTLEQERYLNNIIGKVDKGYMICDFISNEYDIKSMPIGKILTEFIYRKGTQGKVSNEIPTINNNRIVVWKPKRAMNPTQPRPNLVKSKNAQKSNAVTYSFSGGRFGDNIIAYVHAKWIAYKYGLPFLYKKFPYSNELNLHDMDVKFGSSFTFEKEIRLTQKTKILTEAASILYTVPFFPEDKFDYDKHKLGQHPLYLPYFQPDWDDPDFCQEVKKCLTPKRPSMAFTLKKGKINVGMHVRRGGGVDPYPKIARSYPLKFPPDAYYIDCINELIEIYPNQQIVIYVFTDALEPQSIIDTFSQAINNNNVSFICRTKKNSPFNNVVTDFYTLSKFDCLIRCFSNFSYAASLAGDYQVMFTPMHAILKNDEIIIDRIEVAFRGK